MQYNQPAPDGPFFLRLYIYRVGQSDGSGLVDASVIPNVVNKLNEYFNPHNIYFSLACAPAPILNTYYWSDPGELLSSSYFQSTTDGINLFILPSGAFNLQGEAKLASNVCFSRYYPDCRTVAHEVGHVLGLYHTFKGAGCSGESGVPENVNGSNGATAGDEVPDTPADPGNYTSIDAACVATPLSSCTDGQGQPYPALSYPRNLMSYGGDCRAIFSNGQGARMRTTIEAKDPTYSYAIEPNVIMQNTTWQGSSKFFDTDITIKAPNTLTITNTVHMAPGKRITVEEGAILRVTGGKITNWTNAPTCYQATTGFWAGIELVGSSTPNGTPARVFVNSGGTVEHAGSAFYYRSSNNPSYPYGVVDASGGNFLNNRITVDFQAFGAQNNTFNQNNGNFFSGCNFIIDDNYLGDEPFLAHILMRFVRKAQFIACNFSNEQYAAQNPLDETWAIKAFAVGNLLVKSSCSVAYPNCPSCPCPPQHFSPSLIDGFTTGIEVSALAVNPDVYWVDQVAFKHNGIGIKSNGVNNFKVIGSTFEVGNPQFTGGFPIGLQINTGTGFTVTGNQFSATGNDLFVARGIEVHNTGTDANVIRENNFAVRTGIFVFGQNRNPNPIVGLQLLCNDNTNQTFGADFRMDPGTTVARNQGTLDMPAGNTFTSGMNGSNIGNSTFNDKFFYFFKGGILNQEPTVTNVDKVLTSENSDCGTDEYYEFALHDWESLYQSSNAARINLEGQQASLLDGGSTAALVAGINGASLQSKSQLVSQLNSITPWLSDLALRAIYDRHDIFTDEERYQWLVSNPDELWRADLMDYFTSSPNAIATPYLNALQTNPLATTARSTLESELGHNRSVMFKSVHGAASLLLHPISSEAVDFSALRTWLARKGTLEGAIEIASTWLAEGNLSAWQNHVAGIGQQIALTQEQEGDLGRYVQMVQAIAAVWADGRGMGELNASERGTILSVAEHNERYVSRLAKNILEAFYGYSFSSEYTGDDIESRTVTRILKSANVEKEHRVVVSGDQVIVRISSEMENGGRLLVFDVAGRSVLADDIPAGSNQVVIHGQRLPQGMYFFQLIGDKSGENSGAFIVR
jgi:hypothetical protein